MSPCTYPPCTGTIIDGYCDRCGMAPRSTGLSTGLSTGISHPSLSQSSSRSSTSQPIGSRQLSGRSRALGLGLLSLPDLPSVAPESLLLVNPSVPQSKRICGNCGHSLRRERGFCSKCGHPYSFVPSLQAGDLIGGHYEVKGVLAYGGLGWIYLGFDQTLSRYVVLKGLLNSQDESSAAVALAERQFLAAVKHPNIVGVYTFVTHGGEGFIVMEYVGGQTLRDLRRDRGPLPVTEAIAYIHRILGAFGYLHDQGLVYCDFKPDNIMLEGGDVKLIDMGGVRRIDDPDGDIYGTVGYSAPEAGAGPTALSDLFTVGRCLAVLVTSIPGFGHEHEYSLPDPETLPLFRQQESLYRLLRKATAPDPAARFQSAEEMAEQLAGVLRETIARETGQAQPSRSRRFGGDPLAIAPPDPQQPIPILLPLPSLDTQDPSCQQILDALAIADPPIRSQTLEWIVSQQPDSLEAQLRWANSLIDIGGYDRAEAILDRSAIIAPWDWRVNWYRGQSRLRQNQDARAAFNAVYDTIPGELMPKLALGMAAEQQQDFAAAIEAYGRVVQTDPSYVSAAFGLARCHLAIGDRNRAIEALDAVPIHSTMHGRAQLDRSRLLLTPGPGPAQRDDLQTAAKTIGTLRLAAKDQQQITHQLLQTALDLIDQQAIQPDPKIQLLGQPLEARSLRLGLEQVMRDMARLSQGAEKIRWVEEANRIRPRSWV